MGGKPTPNARDAACWLPVADLRPNPRNPRLHGSEVAALARTILRTAWGAPIVAQARGRRVIGGHGRLEAAKLILAGLEVDGELRGGAEHSFGGPVGCVPVRLVDVSDAEADAMTLADNARGLQGTDSAEAIVAMAAGFGRESALMADMGFDGAALDALVKAAGDAVLAGAVDAERPESTDDAPRERVEVEEDEAPVDRAEELRAKWGTASGQLWVIPSAHGGEHRILCGDSTKAENRARLMDGATARLMVTDPPYGVDYGAVVESRQKQKKVGWDDIHNDGLEDDELEALLRGTLDGCGAAVAFVWHPPGAKRWPFWRSIEALGWRVASEIVWVKNAAVLGWADYQWQHEPCIYAKRDGAGRQQDRTQTTVWQIAKTARGDHPTQKPVEVFARSIRNHTAQGDLVHDPFGGSGTTAVAAEQLGRLGRLIELEPKYVAVALERLSALGLTPRLVA